MPGRAREAFVVTALLLLAALVFTFGITWGLPSRKTDAFLFGERKPWTGAEILALAPQRSGGAADVDVNPAARGSVLNDTDAKRAEIVRRYRLFTYQPDEMITMMSLAGMHPSKLDFDPRLYQYGGLWIYPVGGLIKILLHPTSDQAYYLDHPEEFAKFYIVARAYSAAWGVVGAWAVYRLMRTLSRNAAILATLLYITMPVVVNMAHEAKPHLPGTALMLLAALAARNFIQLSGWRRLTLMSILCGAAAGMILSAGVAVIIAIVAIILRTRREPDPLSLVPWGRGEGPSAANGVTTRAEDAPHPNPLPRVRGRGDQEARLAPVLGATQLQEARPVPEELDGAASKKVLSAIVAMIIAVFAVERKPSPSRCARGESGGVGISSAETIDPVKNEEPSPQPSPRVQGEGGSFLYCMKQLIVSMIVIGAVYALTNPYVIKHLLTDRSVLTQNLANSKAMYHVDFLAGTWRAIELIAAGCGWLTLVGGGIGLIALRPGRRRQNDIQNPTATDAGPIFLPLIFVSAVVAIQFAAFAAGKPGEYGRFGLVVDVTLGMVVAARLGVAQMRSRWRIVASFVLLLGMMILTALYEYGFWSDSRNTTRRDQLAETLRSLNQEDGFYTLGVIDEPAPYLLPPIDLWRWSLVLVPHDARRTITETQVLARPNDGTFFDPTKPYYEADVDLTDLVQPQIGWANKMIEVWLTDSRSPATGPSTRINE